MTDPIATEGVHCWRRVIAGRVAPIVDAAEYYLRLHQAISRAQRSVYIAAWDIDTRTPLVPLDSKSHLPHRLGDLLDQAARRCPELEIRVLCWDFAFIYAFEREPFPRLQFRKTHERVHFALDDKTPTGGSAHHKIVVVDERIAFVGGIDICNRRWDAPTHDPEDPRRIDLRGDHYLPHHDLQVAIDGPAAEAVAELFRERWCTVTGDSLPPRPGPDDPWPSDLRPSFHRVSVALARTRPAHASLPAQREIEQLFLAEIAAARRQLYIENPYPTSRTIADALAARLREPDPPEIVLVGPQECSGWLEEVTMGVLRGRFVQTLHAADHAGRLGVYSAVVPDAKGDATPIKVHSKILIADDRVLHTGSANLSARSMGFDLELDLQIEAGERPDIAAAITDFRTRLLAEHLGSTPEAVDAAICQHGSLLRAIDHLRDGGRTLRPDLEQWTRSAGQPLPDESLVDPEQPLSLARIMAAILPASDRPTSAFQGKIVGLALLILGCGALVVAGAAGVIEPERLLDWTATLREAWYAPFALMGVFVVAGMVLVPVTLMIATAGLLFGPVLGTAYGLSAALTSAVAYYGLGRWLGHDAVRKMAGSRLDRVSRLLARRGLFAVAAIRTFPIAPHVVVGLVSGASHIGLRDYFLGSAIAMAPGTVILATLGHQLGTSIRDPDAKNVMWLVLLGLVVLGVAWFMQRWLGQRRAMLADESQVR